MIDNIEAALRIWDARGYKTEEDFNFFKEFILPYRTSDEYISLHRSQLREMYDNLWRDSDSMSTFNFLERYKIYVDNCRWINSYVRPQEDLGMYDLFVPKPKMNCHAMTNWSCNILRVCGIPAVYEFTPKWLDRDNKHFWCASPDSMGIVQPYSAPTNNLREDWEDHLKYASKVYRRTFGAQPHIPYFIAGDDEYIPEPFDTPLISDQTFRYHQTVTLRLPLKEFTDNKLAYICMFTSDELIPVGWGTIDQQKQEIIFEQIPLNVLFFPVSYDGEAMFEVAQPFMIASSQIRKDIPEPLTVNNLPRKVVELSVVNNQLHCRNNKSTDVSGMQYITLKCDKTRTQTLHVLRKYPEKRNLKALHEQMKGAFVSGGNKEKGKDFDTLYVMDHTPQPYLQEIKLNNHKKYRYYRFSNNTMDGVQLAYLEFLGNYSKNHKCLAPTSLPVFSEEDKTDTDAAPLFRIEGTPLKTGRKAINAFDRNWETYVTSSSVGMDFKYPVCISHIRFMPRTANNGIVRGDSYSLYYYDNGWNEFKVMYAENNYLKFDDVPVATLYWLRNLTEGKEELPFFYYEGKQYFLHVDHFY